MPKPFLLFDLDGTISDPLLGFERCMNYALEAYGYAARKPAELMRFIGPPLEESVGILTGSTESGEILGLVAKYRQRYGEVGYTENTLYPGMAQAIETLASRGTPLGICSSKRKDFVESILRLFGLRDRFRFVSGGDIGVKKSLQIGALLADGSIDGEASMIGDRSHDMIAARENGLAAIGVLWGYGSRAELEAESPYRILAKPEELETLAC